MKLLPVRYVSSAVAAGTLVAGMCLVYWLGRSESPGSRTTQDAVDELKFVAVGCGSVAEGAEQQLCWVCSLRLLPRFTASESFGLGSQ